MQNTLQSSSDLTTLGISSSFFLIRTLSLICASLVLLIIFYFVVSGIVYVFRKKFIGPEWLPRVVSIIFALIVVLYFIFPDLAIPWSFLFLGGTLG